MFGARLATKTNTKPYRSINWKTENIIEVLNDDSLILINRNIFRSNLLIDNCVPVKMSMIYTNILIDKHHLFHIMKLKL